MIINNLPIKKLLLIWAICIPFAINAQNLISPASWNIGSGSIGVFSANGSASENIREWGIGPNGERVILWKAVPDAANNADGGWNTSTFSIDHTKMYRFTVWIKKTNSNSGHSYLGCHAYPSPVTTLAGTVTTNPYFWVSDPPELDKWYFIVGYIHGSGDTSTTSIGGIYDGVTGVKVGTLNDFKFQTTATTARHRTYLYYDTNTADRQYFYAPRVDMVTGDEPSIESLLSIDHADMRLQTSIKTLNAGWYTIAKNGGNRASAKFSIRETKSSNHSAVHFYAQHHYGTDISNQINVLAKSYHGNRGAIQKLRIVEGTTYAGAYLQVYIDGSNTGGCYAEITENIQSSGWSMVNWEPATTTLPNGETGVVRTEVNLDINNGAIISHDLFVGNKLEVNGTIRSKEVKVEAQPWPDYVFAKNYELTPLAQIKSYVAENHHLPDVPSADQVAEEGINLGEMNAILLKKIEELTLHVIQLNEKISSQDKIIQSLTENKKN